MNAELPKFSDMPVEIFHNCFSDIYTRIYHKKIQFLILSQVAINRPLKKRYSSSYKPSLSGCDSSNCSITNITITIEIGQDGVDKHVQSLLDNDYDDTKELADGISAP
ncbi:8997_t:CDS:2 [Funneliformis caledonium]|uniref:8997_t:CDS:1 n=1 Tax=Funneliformis caledonium TaxID=1117310 RepID=A0A9N9EDZ4_9GLOM|nr:8997_t:CDS:2 [Funneliformis caledonium]